MFAKTKQNKKHNNECKNREGDVRMNVCNMAWGTRVTGR